VTFNKFISYSFLTSEEYITIGAAVLLNTFMLVFIRTGGVFDFFVLNSAIMVIIAGVAFLGNRFDRSFLKCLRDWYTPAVLIVFYLENRTLIPLVNPHDMDEWLIRIDQFLFLGHHPTILMERFTSPVLSEVLQIFYASFYFLPFALSVMLYVTKPRSRFHISASTILVAFYLSYIGYYITPAIGPRFTLDYLQTFQLKGVFLFADIRNMLAEAEGVMRDCCPSGHTMISVLTVLLARRYARRFFPVACIWAGFIIFSSVYLRYHYVVDLIAGAILSFLVYRFCPGIIETLILNSRKAGVLPDIAYTGKARVPVTDS